jgi:hypothetical protein
MTATALRRDPVDDWRAGVGKLRADVVPDGVSADRWELLVLSCQRFMASSWPARFAAIGWDALDLFGCHFAAPAARTDTQGLVWYLRGCVIEQIGATGCILRNSNGAVQSYTHHAARPHGQVVLWELST